MKKLILALVAMFTMTVTTASAMSYEQARQQALFLTDKMAYELNLTDDQYEAAYEVNLDYLMGVNTVDDLYGAYWRQRNLDLSYILLDWQYRSFLNATYFYRPLYWDGGYWHFGIYARYPHRDYFYFGRPHFYASYHGGHSWRVNGGRSWYNGRSFGGPRPGGQPRMGMRDGFNRGDYGRGQSFGNLNRSNGRQPNFGGANRPMNNSQNGFNRPQGVENNRQNFGGFGNQNRSVGSQNRNIGNRESSTRTTVTRENGYNNNRSNSGSFGGSTTNRSGIFGGNRGGNSSNTRSFGGSSNSRSFNGGSTSTPSKSFTPRSTPSNSGSFGGGSRSFGGSRSSGGSFGGGSHGGSFGGGSHSNGGGSFGGRR